MSGFLISRLYCKSSFYKQVFSHLHTVPVVFKDIEMLKQFSTIPQCDLLFTCTTSVTFDNFLGHLIRIRSGFQNRGIICSCWEPEYGTNTKSVVFCRKYTDTMGNLSVLEWKKEGSKEKNITRHLDMI